MVRATTVVVMTNSTSTRVITPSTDAAATVRTSASTSTAHRHGLRRGLAGLVAAATIALDRKSVV